MGNTNNQKKEADNEEIISEEKLKNIKSINLIETVKSKNFTIKIFSYLEQLLKLKIINYNKNYQSLLLFNIEYYKENCQKTRVMETNGFGKEYTKKDNSLIFEGEFKNGKKNGKGKEYQKVGEINLLKVHIWMERDMEKE